jgi:YD repeat-containing protein
MRSITDSGPGVGYERRHGQCSDLDSLAATTVGWLGPTSNTSQMRRRCWRRAARTRSLGVTLAAAETDRFSYDKQSLLARIKVATGGRTAEELVFGEETTGAEAGIRRAADLARAMVGRFGMSEEIGFV